MAAHTRTTGAPTPDADLSRLAPKDPESGGYLAVHERAKALTDVPRKTLDEIERFFVSYNAQRNVRFEPLRRRGAAHAIALVSDAEDRLKREQRQAGRQQHAAKAC